MLRLFCFILFLAFSINQTNANDDASPPIFFTKAEVLDTYTTRIPFKLIDHLIVVEAELLNKKGSFIIDTGSETMILNKVHFPDFYEYQRKNQETSGVIQSIDNSYERRIEAFALESLKLHDKDSDVIDISHIEKSKKIKLLGIIGYNILKDYEVFIDLHLNQITLTQVDRFGNKLNDDVYLEKIVDSLSFNLKNHTIIVNGTINNQKVKFGIDTAAEFNQINRKVNRKALKYFIPKRRLSLSGVGNKKIEVLAGKLHRVKLSETIYFGPMLTVLTNLNKMNEAFGTQLDGILGYEFFAQKRTIINYQKEKLYFIDYPLNTQ
ncbi:retropepsin-like aspartic protease [Flavivirga spongiicola]|uniref:Retropepsin-like domain-containing protein n=1 Tax=Flavivirga spongiicola TaxID=421621 RepID=A0ABU7XXP2_9FLAO|nr:retropepsin-like aspartic protease [Flavivirga sp. MEBiC05379]MDO5980342.1 retropepsin-like aspartic protease [Flavivirga sp. MEBiC05379]